MTEFNPATMNPASIILKETIPNNINLSDHILILICIVILLYIIVKKCITFFEFADLPILFIDDWSVINEAFLNQEYERITNAGSWNMDKLKFGYWANLINNID